MRHAVLVFTTLALLAAVVPSTAVAVQRDLTLGARGSIARADVLDVQQFAIDLRGRPVAAIAGPDGAVSRLALFRWTAAGRQDSSFGDGSRGPASVQFMIDGPVNAESAVRLANAPDGAIVAAVALLDPPANSTAVARVGENGVPVPGFGTGGVVIVDGLDLSADPVALADGGVLLAGGTTVTRLSAAGTPDPTFGSAGAAAVPGQAGALAVAGDRVLVGMRGGRVATLTAAGVLDGAVRSVNAPASASVQELRAVGSRIVLRGTFAQSEFAAYVADLGTKRVTTLPRGSGRLDDRGRIVMVSEDTRRVRRYRADGRPDQTLRGSIAQMPGSFFPTQVALAPDGRIFAGGIASTTVSSIALAAVRADGSVDRAFGGPSLLTLRSRSARLDRRSFVVRVHCADDGQRRCEIAASAGPAVVRARIPPGAARKVRVPISDLLVRGIRRSGPRNVQVRLTVVDETNRLQTLRTGVVVRP